LDQQERERIQDDLRGVIEGDLLFDDLSRALYSTDASFFEVKPLGIVLPKHVRDVQALVRYAAEHSVPLTARGAGSGVAGQALGSGLIVDFSRYFRGMPEIQDDTVRVQPGVVLATLNEKLATVGRRLAPDPVGAGQCTVGGMLGINASGPNLATHGYLRNYVTSMNVVLDSGDLVTVERSHRPGRESGHLDDIVTAATDLLEDSAALIEAHRPKIAFDRCGYHLFDALKEDGLDVAGLLVGSEGTLAMIVEATLKTIALSPFRSVAVLGFASLETAIEAVRICVELPLVRCALFDNRLLSLARSSDPAVAAFVPAEPEFVMVAEYEGTSRAQSVALIRDLIAQIQRRHRLASFGSDAIEEEELAVADRLGEAVLSTPFSVRGAVQPVSIIDDVAVPTDQLLRYVRRLQEVLQQNELIGSILIHAHTGQVQAHPFADPASPADIAKLWNISEIVHQMAIDLGGTVSSQRGSGLARTRWIPRQYGSLSGVFRELKAFFDPHGIFNPGQIVGNTSVNGRWPIRQMSRTAPQMAGPVDTTTVVPEPDMLDKPMSWRMQWKDQEIHAEIRSCNGCGHCRTESPGMRMCPIFRALPVEAASPRAKANLLRHLLYQSNDSRSLSSEQVRAVADLCVNCRMCAGECPAHVNIPKLMLEAKAANVAEHGLDRANWALARTDDFAAFGGAFAFVVNAALGSRTVRWLMERLLGVSAKRALPAFERRSFLSRARRRGWTKPPRSQNPRVAYFVDTFANYSDPLIGEAIVAVLHHQGIEVYVPPGQTSCGMTALAQGDVDAARESAQQNVRVLAEAAREGYPILCSEPTAALMLSQDYPELVDDGDARVVASKTVEFTAFMWQLHRQGRMRTDFASFHWKIGYHIPCHMKALRSSLAGPALVSLIPAARVSTIDRSCSGMAGTYGLGADHYDVSLRAGRPMLEALAEPRFEHGCTECSACRMQMENGTRKRTLHPAQYLALAYGLMPEMQRKLQRPVGALLL
jgi:FAD/FMN-containing dehydrogenase/Fe-S oxidoreductase